MLGYARWLHTMWPAGTVEKLPLVNPDGSTNVPGLYIVGDLTGIPLLKFSADTGARAVMTIAADPAFQRMRAGQPEVHAPIPEVVDGYDAAVIGDAGDDGGWISAGAHSYPLPQEPGPEPAPMGPDIFDLVILGAGISGMAAALEAKKRGLRFAILEATEPFSTIVNFPRQKPIYTYPTDMKPAGDLQFTAQVKEPLVDEIRAQTRDIQPMMARAEKVVRKGRLLEVVIPDQPSLIARRVIVAIGRSGNFRKLGVPGEDRDKVYNRLHDPKEFAGRNVLVVGGGDSALECAIACAQCGANVIVSYRKKEFSRPKPDNVERLEKLRVDPMADVAVEHPTSERVTTSAGAFLGEHRKAGSIRLLLGSAVKQIEGSSVTITDEKGVTKAWPNDVVFTMIGREAPLDFFRRSAVAIAGETRPLGWILLAAFLLFCTALYNWKSGGWLSEQWKLDWVPGWISSFGESWKEAVADRKTVVGTLAVSMKSPSFWYTALYTLAIGVFGLRRIRKRPTPYVKLQTAVLFTVQFLPLWLLPELALPLLGYHGVFQSGAGATVANNLFELYVDNDTVWPDWGHPRAYWRAYGFILAFPLNVYNVLGEHPRTWWLVICFVQTFVLIPLIVWRWGKGAYCGWICSCGALAETLGDGQRHKMPHGPVWNRLNMLGQGILWVSFILLAVRIWGWAAPDSWASKNFDLLLEGKGKTPEGQGWFFPLNYKWVVDVFLGGILGVGLYFKYSGRVWCRFACPLAALMHVYARFSKFRIVPEKKKCISCNVCTSVCHQGIDVMNFANKGLPMADPECVRCSACVQMCPTGTLQFGWIDQKTGFVKGTDRLPASPVLMAEKKPAAV
jgi:NosR/NirI family nitrous oxide reductase transcriptional regulator